MDEERTNNKGENNQERVNIVSRIVRKLDEFIRASQEEIRQGREKMRRDGHLE